MADLNPRIDFLDAVSDDIPKGESTMSSSISVCLKSSIVGNDLIYFDKVQLFDVPTISVEVSSESGLYMMLEQNNNNKAAF